MASISSLGIGSGLDLNGLLDQLNAAERGKLKPIESQIKTQQVKISAYGELKGALSAFQTAANALNDASLYQSLSTSTTGEAIQAAAGADASLGRYEVEVETLASAGSYATARLEGIETLDDSVVSGGGTLQLQFAHANGGDGESVPISIDDNATLADIRDAINAEQAGVTASIVNDGDGYRLALMSTDTGEEASITGMDWSGVDLEAGVSFSTTATAVENVGKDAELTVNGIAISSPSNQVEGAIQGVTLNLTGEGSSTVKVEQNTRAVREAITGFVEAFNALKGTIGKLTAFTGDSETAGDLLGDSAVRSIESQLRSVLAGGVAAEEGGFAMLSDIGISLKLDGTLEIDQQRLDDVIANDQDALSAFFAGDTATGGLAGQLSEAITQLNGNNGALGGAISGAESRIESLNERYARMEQSIDATIARYRTQFGQLDGMIAQMNQTSDYLFQQFEMMNAQLGRK
ncbi:flagellar hook protein [Billgrantia tianxiuensis]|jgi:flagellar hook-associated protein 2|uniref:Flagellar hook-associated protein 2 n=2 Tax=Billgrantia tianxiuensis TaxID=2497861 RepID=A0A6I6SRV8_9GAMM|nr:MULTISPECIES: flagellar filament capping protein FliD [Halomonas]MCE8034524.1 flagellar filament capping protein FliD [Halomonas sp. MCCC 1A11057]QHC52141.1 flagellar hook protein [Halomonas tianxiuensis]